jgi:predicted amidohydrolase
VRVTVLELPARWGQVAQALAEVDALLGRGPATDLVLLPEASLTGYVSPRGDFDVRGMAEPLDGATATALRQMAVRHGVYLVGPLIEAHCSRYYNATLGFAPDGAQVLHYRKRHPWFPESWATPGTQPHPVVQMGPLAVMVAVCFDVHFLADEAASQLEAADLLLFPSAWVDRDDTRVPHLVELATGFDLAVANANWAPGVVRVHGQGGSCLLGADGRLLAEVTLGARRADADVFPPS